MLRQLITGAVLFVGLTVGWQLRATWSLRARAEAQAADARLMEKAVQVSADVGAKVEARAVEIRERTRTIVKEVPVYVTAEADRHCDVPVGFVRLHDAAAAGVPPTPAESPDAPSGVALSAVAATVAENYGTCHELRSQVLGWQDWYAQTAKAWNAGR